MINNRHQYSFLQHSDTDYSLAGPARMTLPTFPMLPARKQTVSYTAFNEVSHIAQHGLDYNILFNVNFNNGAYLFTFN